MDGLGLAIPQYDPKVFLSQVSIFGKRKVEDQEIKSKYRIVEAHNDNKKVKHETNKEDLLTIKIETEKNSMGNCQDNKLSTFQFNFVSDCRDKLFTFQFHAVYLHVNIILL